LIDLATIKTDLPDWPDDVIDQWLLKLANRGPDTGWPPPEDLNGHAWRYILGCRSLAWWKNVTWTLEELDFDYAALSLGTKRIVNAMIDGHINDKPNLYSSMPDSMTRFQAVGRYIAKHGVFPKPPVAIRLVDGLSVLDGNHRVAAFCACRGAAEEIVKGGGTAPLDKQRFWVGEHSAGEVPL
jgi:hypothetical protein